MEVKLDKRYPVAASVDQAWAVLRDIRAVAACMPGAQITEQIDETHFKGTVKSKVGPAVMRTLRPEKSFPVTKANASSTISGGSGNRQTGEPESGTLVVRR